MTKRAFTELHRRAAINKIIMTATATATAPTGNITLELYSGTVDSVILLKDAHGVLGRKYYTLRTHKYESSVDFKRLATELQTYGYQHGLLPEWERLQAN